MKPKPTPEQLRKLLRYEPETGQLFWRERDVSWFSGGIVRRKFRPAEHYMKCWNTKHAGKPALAYADRHGYLQGRVLGVAMKAHTAIWAMMTGEYPIEIDHQNGRPGDNRWINLCDVTHAQNQKNMKLRSDSKYPAHGIETRPGGNFVARIYANGERYGLGTYEKLEDAVRVRRKAEAELGFHQNHGRRSGQPPMNQSRNGK